MQRQGPAEGRPPASKASVTSQPSQCRPATVFLQGKARDVKQHRWFESFDWEALAARKLAAPRSPRDDAAKRIRELAVSGACAAPSRVLLVTSCPTAWQQQ